MEHGETYQITVTHIEGNPLCNSHAIKWLTTKMQVVASAIDFELAAMALRFISNNCGF